MCRWGGAHAEVKALLETHELILRGDLKKKVPIAELTNVRAAGDELTFKVGREAVRLNLGEKDAASWATKIKAPPRSLKDKLGLTEGAKAFVVGAVKDAALKEALKGAATKTAAKAAMAVAVVENAEDLAQAIRLCPKDMPIWIVHRKGKTARFGETPVRAAMRAKGFTDTKLSAVSEAFSAARYSRKV